MYQDLPFITVDQEQESHWEGWEAIYAELSEAAARIDKSKVVIVVECYHGTLDEVNFSQLKRYLAPEASFKTSHLFLENETIAKLVYERMGQGQGRQKGTGLRVEDYFDPQKLEAIRESICLIDEGLVLAYGVGASLAFEADLLVYADMSQWEAQQRLRRGDTGNIGMKNAKAGFEEKHRIAFFNDWPACNQLKRMAVRHSDYYLETNNWARPKMASGDTIRRGLEQAAAQPLKLAPFFDPDLWEQQQRHNGSSQPVSSKKWPFNCVPEENNLLFRIREMLMEVPLLNLIYYLPDAFLGKAVHRMFGPSLPVRLHFIDADEYQGSEFQVSLPAPGPASPGNNIAGASVTGCYLLESDRGARLELATSEAPHEAYSVREVGMAPHDFVQIPLGMPFRLGNKMTALQIDAAPNVFSEKIPIEKLQWEGHGAAGADIDLYHDSNSGRHLWHEEVLSDKLIKLTRNWFPDTIKHHTKGVVNILVLVAGEQAVVESPDAAFKPLLVRYGETFIVPAKVGVYQIRPLESLSAPFATLKAVVKEEEVEGGE